MVEFEPGKDYRKETESKVIIRFQDCDPLRHLNNAKYFDYFFNAREDQVAKIYNLQVGDFYKKYHAAWVVYNHQISYIKPANMGEWVKIMTRLIWFNENTILIEYYMTDENKTHLKTLLWTTMKYVDIKSGNSTEHQGRILDFLKATVIGSNDIEELNYNERIKEIKKELSNRY
jgi:thioesterase III